MLDVAPTELLLVAVVALVVIGPKDLPKVMRTVGHWVGRARGVARHFRSGLDTMMREAELEEMEKKWKAENERIMLAHPDVAPANAPAEGEPAPPTDAQQLLPLPDSPQMLPLPGPDEKPAESQPHGETDQPRGAA